MLRQELRAKSLDADHLKRQGLHSLWRLTLPDLLHRDALWLAFEHPLRSSR